MNFNFSYAPGTSLEQMIGFEMAGRLWSSYLADDVTVNLYIETTDSLPSNIVGGALLGVQANQSYETWRNKLASDRTSADDQVVYQNQQDDADKFTALIDGFKIDNNQKLNVSRANAKALQMRNGQDKALDGIILMNNLTNQTVQWNYDALGSTVPSNSMDFFSVALHEIGHTLGFYSGIDKAGWLTGKTQYDDRSDFYDTLNGALDNATVLDMFRFSAKSVQAAGTSDSWIDLSIGGTPYFSLDGGKTSLGYFSTGDNTSLGGDGDQASHWKHQTSLQGIMDPTINSGEERTITTLDQRTMDAIGWDIKSGGANLATLQAEAKAALAQRLGVTVAALEVNPAVVQQLTQDRTQDVYTMLEESEIYNWRSSSSSSTTGWWQEGVFQHLLQEKIEISEFDSGSLLGEEVKSIDAIYDNPLESGWDGLFQSNQDSDELIGGGSTANCHQSTQDWGDKIRDFVTEHNLMTIDQSIDRSIASIAPVLNYTSQFNPVSSGLIQDTSSSF